MGIPGKTGSALRIRAASRAVLTGYMWFALVRAVAGLAPNLFANFIDKAPADALERRADQEPIATALLDRFAHAGSDLIRSSDQVEAVVVAFRGELSQCLAATPLLELVERARLAIGG